MRRTMPIVLAAAFAACNAETGLTGPSIAPALACTGYLAEHLSPFRLPYAVGAAFLVTQANCQVNGTHNPGSVFKYGYDFRMPIGTPILAARAGTVIDVEERFADFNVTAFDANYVFVQHADGSVARYFHLTQSGARVRLGAAVLAGDLVGLSGATGLRDDPHLHFDVIAQPCPARTCASVPVTFHNTRPHPGGLREGERYVAGAAPP